MKKDEYVCLLNKYVDKYKHKIIDMRNDYISNNDSFINLNKKYKECIVSLICELCNDFKCIYNIDFCAVLSGSLARNSNTLFSDIDINYLVKDNNRDILLVEDEMNYIIQCVMGYRGKDKIHSMVVYMPLISNNDICINNNIYKMKFIDGYIDVPLRDNSYNLMYKSYNSTRNIYDVINYLNCNDCDSLINEWTYCFLFVDSSFKDIFDSKRNINRCTLYIDKFKDELCKSINDNNVYLTNNESFIKNSDLKSIYKKVPLLNYYKLLAIYYRLDKCINKFSIDEFKNSDIGYLVDDFNSYLEIIQRLQFILDKNNIDLSSHSNILLDINQINELYKSLFNMDNIISDLNDSKRKLYNNCNNYLKGLK